MLHILGRKNRETAVNINFGELWTWGEGNLGVTGHGNQTDYSSPVQVGALETWKAFTGGGRQNLAIAIKTDGTIWSWGTGALGGNGRGNTTSVSSPVQIGGLTTWVEIANGQLCTKARKSDGTLWTWGYGGLGHNGLGDTLSISSPQQVGSLTTWGAVIRGNDSVQGGITTSNVLWMWGNNDSGGVGDSTTNRRSSPVQVTGDQNYASGSAGYKYTVAVKTDGTLWTWGYGGIGSLGHGNTTSLSSPAQVGSLTNWATVSCGTYGWCALKTDGTLWACGLNNSGQIGDGTTTNRSSPVQIGTDTNWMAPASGRKNITAAKTNGTLWAWGEGSVGEIGEGATTDRSAPVQVGVLTTWAPTNNSSGGNNPKDSAFAIKEAS